MTNTQNPVRVRTEKELADWPGPGHPRHQLRMFTVTVRRAGQRPGKMHVPAQTGRDAILRAGMALARRYPAASADLWSVTSVDDPAPSAWSPPGQD